MSDRKRIDVHQHIVPPFWADALPAHGGDSSGWSCPAWSVDSALAFMDSVEIATGVLSLTAPGVKGWHGQEKRDIARKVNDYTADVVAKHPTRFGNFATLPLPDVDGTLAEIDYTFDSLNVDGVVLLSNYEGVYLGDPVFEPVWAELNRRHAVAFIHPTMPPIAQMAGMPGPMLDYPFDTTRTAVQLVLNGVVSRYPNVRIILSHAGGFLPYAAYRVAQVAPLARNDVPAADGVLDLLRKFYFDTALSSPSALPSLAAFADPSHILFGSDFPYAPAPISSLFTAEQDASTVLGAAQHAAINRDNALPLFPRLAASNS
ncbi:amidohydrolase [Burkholderia multivorans]|uniref:amidohydrolase family protein n=1 Tax=Burkholderia cepacia complex TaxID=87882 RepID=UPI0007565C60|nr:MULTISPECIES: amidohydrolase family protein [Burkholderia cepacia complex]KVV21678.1 amidohydrolase [Burkholderia multivorans]MCA7888634.1 amidohydrolase [Burkholderia contaminans]MDN7576821.1 amidohydrolase family protein [Burkholderia contaminans]PRF33410.1 amidohydrolase [Burkholderia multivorans]